MRSAPTLAEFGIVAPIGRKGVEQLLTDVANSEDKRIPAVARACVAALGVQLRALRAQILEFDRQIMISERSSKLSM
jgi:transposase